jgi:formamidopyrimidine-DNA glycosylase
MPELPEVETTRRGLAQVLTGATLARVGVRRRDLRWPLPQDLEARLEGRRIVRLDRRAKYILIRLDDDGVWLIHLGMSGKLLVGLPDHALHKHDHLLLRTQQASLVFNDYRMFGRVMLHDRADPWADLPPQPQDSRFSLARVRKLLARYPNKPLKALLLDQNTCPGIGNWMADEICWRLGLHPGVPVSRVDPSPLRRTIRFVTFGALKHVTEKNAGASSSGFAPGSYVTQVPPKSWLFQHRWKKGGLCPKCRTPLARDTIATRTTAWCSSCQIFPST